MGVFVGLIIPVDEKTDAPETDAKLEVKPEPVRSAKPSNTAKKPQARAKTQTKKKGK
ncbi:MAG: hypothetical protein KH354_03950 [Clostridiales bacterium]|nr:hypothetical protein [Clostridiales bacterium]